MAQMGRSRQFETPSSVLWRSAASAIADILWAKSALAVTWRLDAHRRLTRARWRLATMAAPSRMDNVLTATFRRWVHDSVMLHVDCDYYLEQALREAIGEAEKLEAAHKTKSWNERKEYINGGQSRGLGRQHKFLRGPQGWTPSRVADPVISTLVLTLIMTLYRSRRCAG